MNVEGIYKLCSIFYNNLVKNANNYGDLRNVLGLYLYNDSSYFDKNSQIFDDWIYQNETKLYAYIPKYNLYYEDNVILYGKFGSRMIISKSLSDIKQYLEKLNSDQIYIDIDDEYMVDKYKEIPRLYFVKFRERKFLNKDEYRYEFLLKYLDDNFNLTKEEEKKFLIKNKEILSKIERYFDYMPKHLGSGDDGVAYDIGRGYVLKLTESEFSILKMKESLDLLFSKNNIARTEMMVYDFGELKDNDFGIKIYYCIMPKMKPVSNSSDNIKDMVYDLISFIGLRIDSLPAYVKLDLKSSINKKETHDKIKQISNDIYDNLNRKKSILDEIKNEFNLYDNWAKLFIEEILVKHLTERGDLHKGNLGVIGGYLRYFDPSHDNWKDKINY